MNIFLELIQLEKKNHKCRVACHKTKTISAKFCKALSRTCWVTDYRTFHFSDNKKLEETGEYEKRRLDFKVVLTDWKKYLEEIEHS